MLAPHRRIARRGSTAALVRSRDGRHVALGDQAKGAASAPGYSVTSISVGPSVRYFSSMCFIRSWKYLSIFGPLSRTLST